MEGAYDFYANLLRVEGLVGFCLESGSWEVKGESHLEKGGMVTFWFHFVVCLFLFYLFPVNVMFFLLVCTLGDAQ